MPKRIDDIMDIYDNGVKDTPQYVIPYKRARECSRCRGEGHNKRRYCGQETTEGNITGTYGNRNNQSMEGIATSPTESSTHDNEETPLIAMLNRRRSPRRTPFGLWFFGERSINSLALGIEDGPQVNQTTQSFQL